MLNSNVDDFFINGCGRCQKGGTPECKIHQWPDEIAKLRELLVDSGLDEERKWGFPVYTLDGKNVLMLAVFKDYCAISFLRGALIEDDAGILVKQGPNTRSGRLFKITNVDEIEEHEETVKAYIEEAIEIHRSGRKVEMNDELEYPDELEEALNADPELADAFEALTPGRQRGYVLHISSAKQSETRSRRIEKCRERIFDGKGYNERY